MKTKAYFAALIPFVVLTQILADTTELPQFLPGYYSPAFTVGSKELAFVGRTEADGVDMMLYSTEDKAVSLDVGSIECEGPGCNSTLDNILLHLNAIMRVSFGRFAKISDSEVHAEFVEGGLNQYVFAYVLPSSVQVWTYRTADVGSDQITSKFELIHRFVNRQRYEEALSAGNVEMGCWGAQIHKHAAQLLDEGKKAEGLAVLKNILTTSPYCYEAHLDFIKSTDDSAAAADSARIVFKNAEDSELIERAAKYLRKDIINLGYIPRLSTNETGLKLILIPLPPCNPWLLDDAATIFRQITDIPVEIRRLEEEWVWGSAERISRERMIQDMLLRQRGASIDFTGWTKDRYIGEMRGAARMEDALSKYYVNDLINKIADEPGQYFVNPYLDRLCGILADYRSADNRTMYVGITEANIYSGDNNYVFSFGTTDGKPGASILSYYMMLGKTLGEEYESRQRLTERIAKELVPAALKQLGIPRSTDPTCPYSYSSGVYRLDQKTLRLSEQVKQALKKIRESDK